MGTGAPPPPPPAPGSEDGPPLPEEEEGTGWLAVGAALFLMAGFVLGVISSRDHQRSEAGATQRRESLKRTNSARITGPSTAHAVSPHHMRAPGPPP